MDITERKHAEEEREKLHQLEADLAHINRVQHDGENWPPRWRTKSNSQ